MDVRVLALAPITYVGTDGSTQHAPLVSAAAGGREALFVLDTGSDVHILTKELVDELGLATEEGEEGVDHSGARMPSWSVADVTLVLGGMNLTLEGPVSIPAPAPFRSRGIGGILSPHHLHPTAVTVIDLVADELLLVEGDDDAVASLLDDRSSALTTLSLARNASFASVVVPAAVRPFDEIPTLLNTGGKRTEFSRSAVPGLGDGPVEKLGGGVSGADVVGSSAGAQVLAVGGHDVPVAELAVRERMHDPQGMVGVDVLQGTVVACGADPGRPVVWQVPG